MPTTITRQKIKDRLKTQLQYANGLTPYYTDFSAKVFSWRQTKFEQRELPAINFRDGAEEEETAVDQDESRDIILLNLPVEIEIVCSGSTSDEKILEHVMDVYRAINTDRTLNSLAFNVFFRSTRLVLDDKEKKVIGAVIKIDIQYWTGYFQES